MAEVLVKKGETILQAEVKRFSKGLIITAKCHPSVEQFFRESTGGEAIPIANFGRYWAPADPGKPLLIYPIDATINRVLQDPQSGSYYGLHRPGNGILEDYDGAGNANCINIGFIRAVGISEDLGVSFVVKGLYTEKQVKTIAEKINLAVKRFYLDTMRPIGVRILMITEEATFV